MIGVATLILFSVTVTRTKATDDFQNLSDDFEAQSLDESRWWVEQLVPGKFWIDRTISRRGERSFAIHANSTIRGCGDACQRNEIRTSPGKWLKFGQEAWYQFSFRIEGDFKREGNTRWVSGQWKQENGRSPFLSQRFDRGVFHIAVHSEDCRVLVARSRGIIEPPGSTIDTNKVNKHAFLENKLAYRCETDLILEQPNGEAFLPNPYKNWVDMKYYVRGGLNGDGLVEIWADNRFIVRVRGSIGHREMSGPNQYFKYGIYRDLMPGSTTVYFDTFRRTIKRN